MDQVMKRNPERRSSERVIKHQDCLTAVAAKAAAAKMKARKCRQIYPSSAHLINSPDFTLHTEGGRGRSNFRSTDNAEPQSGRSSLCRAKSPLICSLMMIKLCVPLHIPSPPTSHRPTNDSDLPSAFSSR